MPLVGQVVAIQIQAPKMDWPILTIALFVGLFNRHSLLIAAWVVVNSIVLSVVSSEIGWYWQSMALWAALFSIKDFAFIMALSVMRAPLMLIIVLFASCFFHQVLRWQVMTYNYDNLSLLGYRPSFMLLLSVAMLATVITDQIQGGGSGGKRVRSAVIYLNNSMGRVFHGQVSRSRQ